MEGRREVSGGVRVSAVREGEEDCQFNKTVRSNEELAIGYPNRVPELSVPRIGIARECY